MSTATWGQQDRRGRRRCRRHQERVSGAIGRYDQSQARRAAFLKAPHIRCCRAPPFVHGKFVLLNELGDAEFLSPLSKVWSLVRFVSFLLHWIESARAGHFLKP